MQMFSSLYYLFFPRICSLCNHDLLELERKICLSCDENIIKTDFRNDSYNNLSSMFWGKIELEDTYCYSYYIKGSSTEKLIKMLKYQHQKEIGLWMGGKLASIIPSNYDFISFVPMHKVKQRKRGFNQAEVIANSIAKSSGIPLRHLLQRVKESTSQTNKSRYDRHYESMELYQVIDLNEDLFGKKVLLVDDVITTGSTLEICASKLKEEFQCLVSLAAFAWTPDDHLILHSV